MGSDIVTVKPTDRTMDHWAGIRLIEWAAGKDGKIATKRKLREDLDAYTAELAGPNPSPMERVLAETAALNWFALRLAEAHYVAGADSENGLSLKQSDHAQRRVDRAHRRFLATLKTLATVRRLGIPAIQVNMAHQQVNVAGS